MKAWFIVAGAAQYARVSRDTICAACERREIRHARVGRGRAIQLTPEWIDAWLARPVRESEDRRTIGRAPVSVDLVSEATS
jgi:excisionase family DNA binding protein